MSFKSYSNSVTRLRQICQSKSRRPFQARGANIKRCTHCLLSQQWCACDHRPQADDSCAVAIVFYQGEIFKPSNSGRLIADTIADNHAFVWQRTDVEPSYQALIKDSKYQPFVVFPTEYAEQQYCIGQITDFRRLSENKIPLFIFLDGTWREARKMFRSQWFAGLPVISLFQAQQINYRLRQSVHDFQLGTADVAIHLFQQLEYQNLSQKLAQYAAVMQRHYLAGKSNLVANKDDPKGNPKYNPKANLKSNKIDSSGHADKSD